MIAEFPPIEMADPQSGLLAIGGDLEVGSLELAYRSGIFPWPVEDEPILWFAPPQRAILEFREFRIPRRLARSLKNSEFSFRLNSAFKDVIKSCASIENRKSQTGTWITPEMVEAYILLHEAGLAQSFEAFNQQGELVGGLYGVLIDRYFAGESMFFRESNASKFALIQAVAHLDKAALTWMDVQMMTPLLSSFGAREVTRDTFMRKLQQALQ